MSIKISIGLIAGEQILERATWLDVAILASIIS